MARVSSGAGVDLTSQHVASNRCNRSGLDSSYADRDRMMIALNSPGNFNDASALGPNHEADGIGIGLGSPFAMAAGVTEIAVSSQRLRPDRYRWIRCAISIIEIAQRRRNGNQVAQG